MADRSAQPAGGPGGSGRSQAQVRRRYKIGADEFRAIMPMLIFAGLWVIIIYGLIIYESLFQLPMLAPVK